MATQWFGKTPAHEGLTAYGLMGFADMQEVYANVEAPMLSRTTQWMLSRRDGKGGFRQHSTGYNEIGSASPEVANAYLVYALSEAGFSDINHELQTAHKKALQTKDLLPPPRPSRLPGEFSDRAFQSPRAGRGNAAVNHDFEK
jgi:hypothetical protein